MPEAAVNSGHQGCRRSSLDDVTGSRSRRSDPAKARKGVQGDVNGLFLVLGLVSLVVGAIGIANVTLVTVVERIGEIGLRRALGASRRHVAGQFLVESTTKPQANGLGLLCVRRAISVPDALAAGPRRTGARP
ncbi:ABC transporter permease [Streptomyces brevispora]|uniref:ABC transporter permease n=1 Tax=Streptomyces brevispora TaxID=887462 RepID=UPI0038288887